MHQGFLPEGRGEGRDKRGGQGGQMVGQKGDKRGGQGGQMVMEGDLTWGGEHTVQYTDDVL